MFCCISYCILLAFVVSIHKNFVSEVTVRPFPEKNFYIGHRNRMVHRRDGIFCHGVLTVFQESFCSTLFLTVLEMNGPVGGRCAASLDMLFLEVFYTILSLNKHINRQYVEIKCQLDATEVFIADLTACSTCFGHHYANHQELKSIIQWLLPVVFRAVVFKLLV